MSDTNPTPWHPLRVQAVVAETHDARSLVFDVPPGLADVFAYRPGQFVTLRLPVAGRWVPRCYSMSSAPGLDAAPRVTVKRVTQGRGSNWICDHVRPGDTLQALAPAGSFTPGSLEGDFVLLAGGSGITPVLSILRSVLAHGSGRLLLLYANRDERSVIFARTLRELHAQHPGRLQVVHWLDSVQGVPGPAQLAAVVGPWAAAQAFICGPGPFMDAAVAALAGAGMDGSRIHVERFASLPDEEQAAALAAQAAAGAAAVQAVAQADVELLLDGQSHRFTCGGQETLLAAALRHRIAAPHSCQAGLCASCRCRVLEGRVHLRHNDALDQRDLDRGYTLACQAVPLTPSVRIEVAA